MSDTSNIFDNLPERLPNELIETLLSTAQVSVERIVSQGDASPKDFWFDQDRPEWVLVLQGAARVRFEDVVVELNPGDFINIPAHRRHRVDWTDPAQKTIWLAIHYQDNP